MRVVAVNKTDVGGVVDALVAMANAKAGDTLMLSVSGGGAGGGGQIKEIKVPVEKAATPESESIIAGKLGIEAVTVTPALAKKQKGSKKSTATPSA